MALCGSRDGFLLLPQILLACLKQNIFGRRNLSLESDTIGREFPFVISYSLHHIAMRLCLAKPTCNSQYINISLFAWHK
jgi:hypothetical protein